MADRRPNIVFISSLHDEAAHVRVLAELRAELSRLSDEVGAVAPDRDPRLARAAAS